MLTVCIQMDGGKISVGVEPEGDDQAQGSPQGSGEAQAQQLLGGGQDQESTMRPVPSIDAALQVARQLLTEAQQADGAQANSDMAQGFGGQNPAPSMTARQGA